MPCGSEVVVPGAFFQESDGERSKPLQLNSSGILLPKIMSVLESESGADVVFVVLVMIGVVADVGINGFVVD